jgi:hypothetical protein
MNLNIQLISNGLIVALQTPQKGNQVVFIPTKEATLAMVQEIFNGIQVAPEPKENTGDGNNITPLRK